MSQRTGLRHRRALGAHHTVARRDGLRREGDGAARSRAPAAHRRRDDLEAAHRRADRARVRAADRARHRRVARRRRRRRPPGRRPAGAARHREPRRSGAAARAARGEGAEAVALAPRGPDAADADRLARGRPRGAAFTGVRIVEEDIAVLRKYVDWTFFFHAWELKGRFPAILDDPEKGAVARDLYGGERAPGRDRAGGVAEGPRRVRVLAREAEGDDVVLDSGSGSRCSASRPTMPTRGRIGRLRTSSRPLSPGCGSRRRVRRRDLR